MLLDVVADSVDAALQPQRQPVAGRVDLLDDLFDSVGGEADDVQDRAEILPIQLA